MGEESRKIVLVDDHAVVRSGVAAMLTRVPGIEVVAQASDGTGFFRALSEHDPDLAVVDLSLPDADGLELIKDAAARYPDLKILVLSMHAERTYAERAIRAGARGYVMKSEEPAALVQAVRRVLDGGIHLSESMQQVFVMRMASGHDATDPGLLSRLTDRELTVFRMLGEGLGTSEIAERLNISAKTVQTYRERLKQKLSLKSGRELVRQATLFVERPVSE